VIALVDAPTERTTAATDALLALLALAGLVLLWRLRPLEPWKVAIWSSALASLIVASALGAVAHGLQTSRGVHQVLWLGIFLSLGLLVAFFVAGAVHDLRGGRAARRAMSIMIVLGILFFAITQLIDGAFIVFIVYEALALSFALLGYLYLARGGQLPGAGVIAAGILVTLLAALIQATRLIPTITVVWTFDHNGLFHLVQMLGVVLIVSGLRMGLIARAAVAGD
jgi:hypothetical protein